MLITNDSAFVMRGFSSYRLLIQSKTSLTIAYYMSGAATPLSALSFNCQMTSFGNYQSVKMNLQKHGIEFHFHYRRILYFFSRQPVKESTAFRFTGVYTSLLLGCDNQMVCKECNDLHRTISRQIFSHFHSINQIDLGTGFSSYQY